MATTDHIPPGHPCWVDVFTSDPERAQAFYGEVLGWTCEPGGEEYGGYFNFSRGEHMVAGGMLNDGTHGTPDFWTVYIAVADAAASVATAVENGANVIVAPMAVGELGTMAVLGDPGGAAIGLWQPGLHKGFGLVAEPGAPSWFELNARDYDVSLPFYAKTFGWDLHTVADEEGFRYSTAGEEESAIAGLMDASAMLPEGVPPNWQVYFGVADTDAALARVVELGGQVVMPAEDSPYGRMAIAADPMGAVFKLVADG